MNKSLQLRRGSTAQHSTFTGLEAELTVDVDKFALILHDGITQGGIELARLDYVDGMLSTKANLSNTLEGYGILDAYTIDQMIDLYYDKIQTDDLFALKADVETTYDIATLDLLLADKSDVISTYSKSDVDILLQGYLNTDNVVDTVNTIIFNYNTDNGISSTTDIIADITDLQLNKFDKTGGTVTGNVTVDGDLVVTGTTTTVDAQNLAISDNFIYLNDGAVPGTNIDLGWAGGYDDGTYAHAGVFRDATDGVFKFFDGYVPEPDAAVNIDTNDVSFNLAQVQVSGLISGESTFDGNVHLNNNTNSKLMIGDLDQYRIHTNGTTSYIENELGDLNIINHNSGSTTAFYNKNGSTNKLQLDMSNGITTLYYAGLTRLNTTSVGITVNGDLEVTGNYLHNGQPMTDQTLNTTSDVSFNSINVGTASQFFVDPAGNVTANGDLVVVGDTTLVGNVNGGSVVVSKQEEFVGTVVSNMIKMTQAEYDSLSYVDPNTFYIIV